MGFRSALGAVGKGQAVRPMAIGLGTIAGMTAITALPSLPFRVPLLTLNRGLAIGTGVGSSVFRLSLIVQIGFVDGPFLRH